MDVFLIVRRKKTAIFLDAKENTTVNELKRMVEGITKIPSQDLLLYKDDQVMTSERVLDDYGFNCSTATLQAPAEIGLAYRNEDTGKFEALEITPLSSPPELPDVVNDMKHMLCLFLYDANNGLFEDLEIIPLSSLTELPDVMKLSDTQIMRSKL